MKLTKFPVDMIREQQISKTKVGTLRGICWNAVAWSKEKK